jgi:DNA polymerase III subunit epsilon
VLSLLRSFRGDGRHLFNRPEHGYAVVDLETTGLSWTDGDRVVEIAVFTLDTLGAPTGSWSTLVKPDREVANTHIHGITDRDVLHAPPFADLVPLLTASLQGRVLAAHGLRFDSAFLKHELALAGYPVRLTPDAGLCTMQLAAHYLPQVPGDLDSLAYASGITLRLRHWALWDAQATAGLLRSYIQTDIAFARHWRDQIGLSLELVWPRAEAPEHILLPRCPPATKQNADDWCASRTWPPTPKPPLPSPRPGRRGGTW